MATKVTLVIPEFNGIRAEGENLGLAYVEASIKSRLNSEVSFINRTGKLTNQEILSNIREINPEIIGFGITSHYMLEGLMSLVKSIRETSNCLIVIGGHYVLFSYQEILSNIPEINIAVLGEGEHTMVEVIESFLSSKNNFRNVKGLAIRTSDGSIEKTLPRPLEHNLDTLPFPTRQQGLPVYNISGSRGCYTTCSFCSVPQFTKALPGRSFRLRSPESIAKEVSELKEMGAIAVSFIDDVFLLPKKKGLERAKQIADKVAETEIKWAFGCRTPELTEEIVKYCLPRGLKNIGLGIESGTPKSLERFSKRASIEDSIRCIELLQKNDVSIIPYFIMFDPDMEFDEVYSNIDFLNNYGLLWPSFAGNNLDPYPGTPQYSKLKEENRLVKKGFAYEAIFKSKEVKEFIDIIKPTLKKAEPIEFKLRRQEFLTDLTPNGSKRKKIRYHIKKLSFETAKFMKNAINGNFDSDSYLKSVSDIGLEI